MEKPAFKLAFFMGRLQRAVFYTAPDLCLKPLCLKLIKCQYVLIKDFSCGMMQLSTSILKRKIESGVIVL